MDKELKPDYIADKILSVTKGYDTEISIKRRKTTRVTVKNEEPDNFRSSSRYTLKISLGRNGKFGGCEVPLSKWKEGVRIAKKLQRSSKKRVYFGIPKNEKDSFKVSYDYSEFDLEATVKELVRLSHMAKNINAHSSLSLKSNLTERFFYNSNGINKKYKKSTFSYSVHLFKGDFEGFGWTYGKKLDFSLLKTFNEAKKWFITSKAKSKIKKGAYNLVLDPYAVSDLLDAIMPAFYATNKQNGSSYFIGKEGSKVFDRKLTIISDGLIRDATAVPFDAEGTPTQRKVLIDKGVFKTYLYDFTSAKKEGRESTGNCASILSKPSITEDKIVVKPGKGVTTREGELYIRDLSGTHMINTRSGNFTLTIEGFVRKDGKLRKVKDVMWSSNIYEMLKNIDIGSKLTDLGSMLLPHIKVYNQSIIA